MTDKKTSASQKAPKKSPSGDGLDTPIQFCPGVGPMRASILGRLGVETVRDLFWHIPRYYEDFHNLSKISQLRPGQVVTVLGNAVSVQERIPQNRNKVRHILQTVIEDETGAMLAVWFNQSYLADKIRVGTRLLLHGRTDLYDRMMQMSSPKHRIVDDDDDSTQGVEPIYPLSEGLTQGALRKILRSALDRFGGACQEFLPVGILEFHQFPLRLEAFRILHFPKHGEGAPTDRCEQEMELLKDGEAGFAQTLAAGDPHSLWEKARKRLVFEEFFIHQFLLRRYHGQVKKQIGVSHPHPAPDPWAQRIEIIEDGPSAWPALFIESLPFQLTADQKKVCREIEEDLFSPAPMNRLLQGDVGSGKTVVSLYAMTIAAAGGRQAALMVPTEILAQQHADTIRRLTHCLPGVRTVQLAGCAAAERRQALESIANGSAQFVVGTHALFQEKVEFARLGLAVVDEQHKFGVEQRQRLIEKGIHPDLLVATATPIPRTLSLTLFGDMDISTIVSLPPNRPSLITRWTQWDKEEKVWGFVDGEIAKGHQVYVVCPIIEPSENAPHLPSTEEAFERLSQTFLPHRRVEILHGRHSAQVKGDLMERMRAGAVDVVVATTVIEVGVDLPNATVMVILGAERFGLAQLHQLRGRVGRGCSKSYCVLVTPSRIPPYAQQRMKIMEKTRDGFVIAEEDLKLRGPGEQFGIRQSGHLKFHLADPLRDIHLLREAHEAAAKLYQDDPGLDRPGSERLKEEMLNVPSRLEFRRPS
ncbi:MAG: ATP-dependent DNA helicase RecG [Candidatus Omnitrophota bacterium]